MNYYCCYSSHLIHFEASSYLDAPIPATIMIARRMIVLMVIQFVMTNNRFLVVFDVHKNITAAILDVLNAHYYRTS
jgi:hypothetical protein